VLKDMFKDVDATPWLLHRWTPSGNVSTLWWGATSADRCHECGCKTHTPAASPKCHNSI